MPRDFDVELGITLEGRDGAIEHRNALGQQLGAVRFELHTLEQQLLVERTARGIDALALGCARALVFAVDDTVAVAVELTTLLVDLGARGRVRALVAGVAHSITVAVELAAGGVDLGTGRCSRALVDVVGYTVAIVIQRTTTGIHRRTGRSARATIELVRDTVAVRILDLARHSAAPGVLQPEAADVVDGVLHGIIAAVEYMTRSNVGAQLEGCSRG